VSRRFSICSLASARRSESVAPDHGLEGLGVDDEELAVLGAGGGGGARPVVEDGHLAEELARPEGGEHLLDLADALGDGDPPLVHHVHLVPGRALLEQDRSPGELPAEALEEWVGGHGGVRTSRRV
jgi:hypothetical protein